MFTGGVREILCASTLRFALLAKERTRIMKGQCFEKLIVAAAVFLLVSAADMFGESGPSKSFLELAPGGISASLRTDIAVRAQHARSRAMLVADATFNRDPAPQPQSQPTPRKRSIQRKVLGSIVGATAGFFAGGYLGAWIDGECGGCDDPGLKGFLIGAPVGAVAGGILGYKFIF
jgi:hypothetical protein